MKNDSTKMDKNWYIKTEFEFKKNQLKLSKKKTQI